MGGSARHCPLRCAQLSVKLSESGSETVAVKLASFPRITEPPSGLIDVTTGARLMGSRKHPTLATQTMRIGAALRRARRAAMLAGTFDERRVVRAAKHSGCSSNEWAKRLSFQTSTMGPPLPPPPAPPRQSCPDSVWIERP